MLLARALLVTLAIGLLAAPSAAEAQQAGKVYRIGFLSTASASASGRNLDAFRQGLRELGYVEGQNIVIEYRWAEGKLDRLPDLAADLVRLKVEVIVVVATPAIRAARQVTSTIPIVMATSFDAVAAGFVASLARPGGNITGLTLSATDVVGKRIELLKEAVPQISHLAVLLGPPTDVDAAFLRETEIAAQALGIQRQILKAQDPSEFDSVFAAMTRERANALLVIEHPAFFIPRARLAELAVKHRLPTMHGLREYVEAGGLMSYGANLASMYRRAAYFVDKILKGAKPADLPVEQPMKFELVINLKTAKALGLTIPQSVLFRADKVIE